MPLAVSPLREELRERRERRERRRRERAAERERGSKRRRLITSLEAQYKEGQFRWELAFFFVRCAEGEGFLRRGNRGRFPSRHRVPSRVQVRRLCPQSSPTSGAQTTKARVVTLAFVCTAGRRLCHSVITVQI